MQMFYVRGEYIMKNAKTEAMIQHKIDYLSIEECLEKECLKEIDEQ